MTWATTAAFLGGIILLAGAVKALPVVWRAVVVVGQAPNRIENIWRALPLIQADLTKLHDCFDRHSRDDEQRFGELKEAISDLKDVK